MLGALFAFITAAGASASFRAPLRPALASGLTGLLGYFVSDTALHIGAPQTLAVFLGALTVGVAGEFLARRLREPTLLFVVPGLFPLVPGLIAYNGMLSLARGELTSAGRELTRTMFYAGALVAGLALPPAILRHRWSGPRT